MIGNIRSGKSAYHLLRYCLEDKKDLSAEQKIMLSQADGLQHQKRAEVLDYNLCFGNAMELSRQFREVEKLSKRVEKPVFHISLRLAEDDRLSQDQWIEIGRECAREFGCADHQYLTILHKDAAQPHIHLVVNRVGFDGKAASDSNSYKRMAALCRRLEKQYKLKEILSPKAFLSPAQQLLPRHDKRKERLHNDLKKILTHARSYASFKQQIKALGYDIIKTRGVSFIDDKKVKIKGSEVGFSLATIEKILLHNGQKAITQVGKHTINPLQPRPHSYHPKQPDENVAAGMLHILFEPAKEEGNYDPIRAAERKRKKKSKGISH